MNIFEECKYDAYDFRKIHQDNRNLTREELIAIKSLCDTWHKYEFAYNTIALGMGVSLNISCIFKIEDNNWITWESDERRGFFDAHQFDNSYDACINIILSNSYQFEENNIDISEVLNRFDNFYKSDYSDEELEEFAKNKHYNYEKNKIKKL